jgi:hypothetical protein
LTDFGTALTVWRSVSWNYWARLTKAINALFRVT